MKVLLVGATGNLGSRLVPALLTHGHSVVAYVRSASKLEALLPAAVYSGIQVVQGNAADRNALKQALLDHRCEAVVNAAGGAAVAPWGKSDLPDIFSAVMEAARDVGAERKAPLRAWMLAGMSIMKYPGTDSFVSDFVPIYTTHRKTLAYAQAVPLDSVAWSMLCPMMMSPESSDLSSPTRSTRGRLTANATSPPLWNDSWLRHIPFFGKFVLIGMNMSRYETTLEQNADFIAADLESGESHHIGKTIGVIDAKK